MNDYIGQLIVINHLVFKITISKITSKYILTLSHRSSFKYKIYIKKNSSKKFSQNVFLRGKKIWTPFWYDHIYVLTRLNMFNLTRLIMPNWITIYIRLMMGGSNCVTHYTRVKCLLIWRTKFLCSNCVTRYTRVNCLLIFRTKF